MPKLEPLDIIVRGRHDSGKTTVANLIKMCLEESGFVDVVVRDVPPLSPDQKEDYSRRLERNRSRPVRITVELV